MPILIRRGGQYVRYNGKYATDIDLCDCTCDDYPPGVCCCDAMGETLYMRLVYWYGKDEYDPGEPSELRTIDLELHTAVDDEQGYCRGPASSFDCLEGFWCTTWPMRFWYNIAGEGRVERVDYFTFFCLKCGKSNLYDPRLSFGYCSYTYGDHPLTPGIGAGSGNLTGYTDCPVDVISFDYSNGGPWHSGEIRRVPFAQW